MSRTDEAGYSGCYPVRPGYLRPGEVHMEHFRLLVTLSTIYSDRILLALELFLVRGLNRQQSCAAAGISQSSLSVKLRQLQDISSTVIQMYPWYAGNTGKETENGHKPAA